MRGGESMAKKEELIDSIVEELETWNNSELQELYDDLIGDDEEEADGEEE